MADAPVYPADDLLLSTKGRVLQSPHRRRRLGQPSRAASSSQTVSSGRYSSLSLRSLPRDLDDPDRDDGADIPDIPLRRRSGSSGPDGDAKSTTPSTLRPHPGPQQGLHHVAPAPHQPERHPGARGEDRRGVSPPSCPPPLACPHLPPETNGSTL